MMRQGNFGGRGNYRGNYGGGRHQGNYNRNQGNSRYPQNQWGGYNSGRPNQNQNQQGKFQGKSPIKNEPAKKPNNTPTKPEEVKQAKPEQQKQEIKSPNAPPAQSPVKKDSSTPAVKQPAAPTPPVKKDEPAKPTGNNTTPSKNERFPSELPSSKQGKQPFQQKPPQQQKQQPPQQQQQQKLPQQQQQQQQQQQKPPQQQQQKPQAMSQDRPPHFQNQRSERPQNQNQYQRQEKPNFQNQRQKYQGNKFNKDRDSSFSKPDQGQSFTEQPQGPKEEKKFTGRCRLFVGNLTPDVTEDDFKQMFEQYGEVSEAYVNSGRGFGFIRMDYRHNAEAAKAALDGLQKKGRTLRVRFATHGAALKVKNIHPFASNELLEGAFAQFGDLERAIVIVDDRGKPTGEGIVEFVRKPGAQQALRRINDGIFLLGSSPRPLVVEPLEQTDEDDGMPEKFLNRNEGYKKEREKEPRFALPGSFEHEFAQRWRQIDDMEKERIERVKKDMEDARLRLDDEMQGALIEFQADQIRKDLMRQQEELRRLEEMRQQDQMRRRQDMEIRQREEERMRAEEDRRMQEMMRGRHAGPMDDMMGGMRDGPGPRGMSDGAPPLPPPPAPPAGMGLDRSGRPSQMPGNYSSQGMGGGMGNSGMGGGSSGGNMGGGMPRQSRFDQQQGSFDSGFQSGGGMGGSMGGSMGGNMSGGPGGPGNMFGSPGMGNSNNMGSGSGQGMRGDRMERRREGGPRDDYGEIKRRRY